MSRSDLIVEGALGRIELTSAALASLVVRAVESVPGVHVRKPRRRLSVSVAEAGATIEVGVVGPLRGVLPDLGERVQRAIADAVRASTSLDASVSVIFEELA